MTLPPKRVVLDGPMRHKMRVQSTATLIIANQHPAGYELAVTTGEVVPASSPSSPAGHGTGLVIWAPSVPPCKNPLTLFVKRVSILWRQR
jgi:hypothetical protein